MKTIKTGNPNQYLKQRGFTWYASVRVPPALEQYVGSTHVRRSLQTRDLTQANRLKHAVVASIKAELEKLRKAPQQVKERGISFADAKEWNSAARELEAVGDQESLEELTLRAVTKAEQVEQLYGFEKAKKWYRTATVTADTLAELMDKYLGLSDFRASTKSGHKKALTDVLEFLKDPEAHAGDITKTVAISYIDKGLTQAGLAHTTIRDRLVSLGGFWNWMASRGLVADGFNPWRGHKISKKQHLGSTPPKRAYTDAELVQLLKGTPEVKRWPTYSYLPDLIVLGLFTGCREEELCSLKIEDIEKGRGQVVISVTDAKTKAGIRFVAVTHPTPLAVLKRRMDLGEERLFPELKPGGLDEKYSASAVKAYGRYRRACGVPDGTDYHSFRRNVITVLERAKVGQVEIARYVGHKVGTMAGDVYSSGGNRAGAIATSKAIRYFKTVEAAAEVLANPV
jgi:integrase